MYYQCALKRDCIKPTSCNVKRGNFVCGAIPYYHLRVLSSVIPCSYRLHGINNNTGLGHSTSVRVVHGTENAKIRSCPTNEITFQLSWP